MWQSSRAERNGTLHLLRRLQQHYRRALGKSVVRLVLICDAAGVEALRRAPPTRREYCRGSTLLEEILERFNILALAPHDARPASASGTTSARSANSRVSGRRRRSPMCSRSIGISAVQLTLTWLGDETCGAAACSSCLRRCVRERRSIRFSTEAAVLEYIDANKLYRHVERRRRRATIESRKFATCRDDRETDAFEASAAQLNATLERLLRHDHRRRSPPCESEYAKARTLPPPSVQPQPLNAMRHSLYVPLPSPPQMTTTADGSFRKTRSEKSVSLHFRCYDLNFTKESTV